MRGREDASYEARRAGIDVAVRADESLRDRANALDNPFRAPTLLLRGHRIEYEEVIQLDSTIARFIEASNARDLDRAVGCFASDATVEDEGRTHRGVEEVRAWKRETEERFVYTFEPNAVESRGGHTVVTGTLAGNLPGSPVELKYDFTLAGDAITSLRIST